MTPSTDWKEKAAADEESRFAGYAKALAEVLRRKNTAGGCTASSSPPHARSSRCCPTCRRTRAAA